ncbi:MAG: DNA repair protein RecO [Patescibacteria group bacterium]
MKAIVLKRRNFRENDQIISFYTWEKGKIDLLAKGVKKISSKNSAYLEPMSFVDIESVSGKEFEYLTGVQMIDYFPKNRRDLKKSLYILFLLSFLNQQLEERAGDKNIFFLLLSFLNFSEETADFKKFFIDIFIFKILVFFGFEPILNSCVFCSKEDSLNNFYYGGGLACPQCLETNKILAKNYISIKPKIIKKLKDILVYDFKDLEIEKADYEEIHKIIYNFACFHCEKKIKDWA